MLLFDGHLDLSMNALEWNRDLTRPLLEVRQREWSRTDKVDRGRGVVTLPEMQRGHIGLCIATQIGRYVAPNNPLPGWHAPEIAWAQTQGQLAYYRALEEAGWMRQLTTKSALDDLAGQWQAWCAKNPATTSSSGNPGPEPQGAPPIGYVLSLEGADSIVNLHYLEKAYAGGLRAIGPAHYGPGRYSPGTGAEGGLTPAGKELVREMGRLNMVLDATHLTDEAFWDCMSLWNGPVWASHQNCRALVPHQRQFSDEQLKELIRRDAVIGAAFDAWMMVPGWIRGATMPHDKGLKIAHIVNHIDHVCQLAGSTRHCVIGTDLDGGYGTEQTPMDLRSIADLQSLAGSLGEKGYSSADVEAIFSGNWLRKLREVLV
jgi:membrane dipeptidase